MRALIPEADASTRRRRRHPMVVELIIVRLHNRSGDDVGTIELPFGWVIEPGDLLATADGRLVCVARVIVPEPGSAVAALVEVDSAVVGA